MTIKPIAESPETGQGCIGGPADAHPDPETNLGRQNAKCGECSRMRKRIAALEAENGRLREALKATRDLICGTASIILMPGRKTLNGAYVSASVVTDAQKAMAVINAALAPPAVEPQEVKA